MKGIENGEDYFDEEELTEANRMNETIMISLRTVRGLDLNAFKTKFGEEKLNQLTTGSNSHIQNGNLIIESDFLKATSTGLLLIDAICADLFFEV